MYLNHVVNKMLISGFGNISKMQKTKKKTKIVHSYFQKYRKKFKLSASLMPLPQTSHIH